MKGLGRQGASRAHRSKDGQQPGGAPPATVVPRDLLRQVRRIEIRTRHLVADLFGGEYHSAFKGRGMEFSEVREYAPGDEIRTIDWNVTARMGHPFVKLYREERELTVILLVDQSASEGFGTRRRLKAELAAEVGSLLALSAVANNDKVGLVLASDRVEHTVPPGKGRRHVLRVVREILFHRPRGRGTDLALALDHVSRMQKRRAVVFLISDFFAAGYEQSLRVASRRHDVVGIRLRDRREDQLPGIGLVSLRDLETGRTVLVDTSDRRVRRGFAEHVVARDARFRDAVRRARVDSVDLWTDRDVVLPLAGFFRERMHRR